MSREALEEFEGTRVPLHLINLIKSLHENGKSHVRLGPKKSESFNPGRSTRQGCLVSPDLLKLMAE